MKRILALILSVLMIAAVTAGCGQEVVSSGTTEITGTEAKANNNTEGETVSYEAKSTDALL